MSKVPTRILAFSLAIAALAGISAQSRAQSTRPQVTRALDEQQTVELRGNTRPEANAANDRGRLNDARVLEHMQLLLRRPPEAEAALVRLIDLLHDPTSPYFHQWLTAEQLRERFGPAQADVQAVSAWLTAHGMVVNGVQLSGMLIDFSGTARQVRETFRTEIHKLDVRGAAHIANMSNPRIPAALADVVYGVISLHDFRPQPDFRPRPNYTLGSGGPYLIVPADLWTIYNFLPQFADGVAGAGETIVLIEDSNVYSTADWTTFRAEFGLSTHTGSFAQVQPAPSSGPDNCGNPGVSADETEATLDAEWAGAAAPDAFIELASCANTSTTSGLYMALVNILDNDPPGILSISYSQCEAINGAAANAAWSTAYQQAVALGVSVFVSAGDALAAACTADAVVTQGIGVSGLASTPYNVAVGGTDLADTYLGVSSAYWAAANSPAYGSALSYIPEIPWNYSCASVLMATYNGYATTYGSSGFCNSSHATDRNVGGSGGPSGCATGSPAVSGEVGGTCQGWPKPSWQAVVGNPGDGVRDIPDVSLFASNGAWNHAYLFCDSDVSDHGAVCVGQPPSTWSAAGGTSFSAPILAGIQALVNQKSGSRQGNPNPFYYALAQGEYGQTGSSTCNSSLGNTASSTCIFYDVTMGDNDAPCSGQIDCYLTGGSVGVLSLSNSAYEIAYPANTGWDFATGIGSVNVSNLVNDWTTVAPAPTVSLSPTILTFAPTEVGTTSAPQVFTLTNTGTMTVMLTSETITGVDASSFLKSGTTCGASLAAGASCTVSVETKPATDGSVTASLAIADNAAGSPQMATLTTLAQRRREPP